MVDDAVRSLSDLSERAQRDKVAQADLATAAADEPVPEDRVSPTPRSQTRIRRQSRARTCTTCTLVRWGKSG